MRTTFSYYGTKFIHTLSLAQLLLCVPSYVCLPSSSQATKLNSFHGASSPPLRVNCSSRAPSWHKAPRPRPPPPPPHGAPVLIRRPWEKHSPAFIRLTDYVLSTTAPHRKHSHTHTHTGVRGAATGPGSEGRIMKRERDGGLHEKEMKMESGSMCD